MGSRIIKTVGLLAVTAVGGWAAYQGLKPGISPLPDALDGARTVFSSEPAGQVSYYVDRQGAGRPLLLIHSINAAASTFEMKPLFDHYRGTRPVYALDWPGYGFSERSSETPYLAGLYSQTLVDMLTTQIGEPADVVAMSLGSEFVARAARERPELFNSVAFISPTGLSEREINIPGEKIYQGLSVPLWSRPLFELLTIRPSIAYFLGKNFVGDVPETMIDYAYATSHQPEAKYAPLYFLSGQMFTPDISRTIYPEMTVPTLVIYDRDPNISFEKLPEVLETNSRWQASRIAPSLGLPHWELPAETSAALEQFWAGAISRHD